MGIIRPAVPEDMPLILERLRTADRDEIRAYTGTEAEFVAPALFEVSDRIWTLATADGEPGAMLGTQPVFGEPMFGWVWMIATDALAANSIEFLRKARGQLPTIHGPYCVLTNHVDARNTLHIRWLKWMGFTFLRRIERHGAESRPFYEFVRIEPSCVSQP